MHLPGPFSRWRLLLALGVVCLYTACVFGQTRPLADNDTAPFAEVAKMTFIGNKAFSSRALRKVIATKKRPLLPWKQGEPYNPSTLDADVLRLRKYYFDRGFLATTVRVGEVQEDTERRRVKIIIIIAEGPPTLVQAVHLEGTIPPELPPMATLLEALPLQPQKRLAKADFESSNNTLLTRLGAAGYARAQVVPHTEVDPEAHTAVITFTLMPGAVTSFGPITIRGTDQVRANAVRRQLTLQEGQQYDETALNTGVDAVYDLGMFQAVTPQILNPEKEGEPLHVDIEVTERQQRAFQVSLGYSTVERFRVQAQWTHRNLFGGAERLALLGTFSSLKQAFEVQLRFPYVLSRRTAFTQTFFVRNEQEITNAFLGVFDSAFNIENDQPAFDLLSYGGEARLEHQFSKTLSGFAGLELSVNTFRNIDTNALTAEEEALAEDNRLFIQFAAILWRTSDSLLNPTRGFFLRGRFDHASAQVISDVSFVRLVAEGRHYQRLWRQLILATRLEIGVVQPYGISDDVPFNVRFFAGGPGSVRGFTVNRVGPQSTEGDPIGGSSLLEGSVELRFPIAGDLGGAVFADFGNVFEAPFTYRLSDLRYAAGVGVRYNTLVGPIRIDVGFIINRRPDENFGRVEVSIGQAF